MSPRRFVYAALTAYTLGFVLFWPRALLVVDESQYVAQAMAFARGSLALPDAEVVVPETHGTAVSDYPPGTSLLQAPLVAVGGWRAAVIVSLVSVLAATLLTMIWLREAGHDEGFALLVPAFFGVAFFGRLAMSDVPSAALVALSLWLSWRTERRGWHWSLAAGFAAGVSVLFRETNVVLLAPIVLGAIVRKKVVTWAIVAGAVIGIAVRLVIAREMFGSALYVRDSGYGFSLLSLKHTLPQYAIILLVMLPAGLLLPFCYRGPRRAEIVTSVSAYLTLFLLYEYDSVRENGAVKGLILTSRYVVPAIPLFAFMAADVFPRWAARVPRWVAGRADALFRLFVLGVVTMLFAIHPAMRRQENVTASIVGAVHDWTDAREPVITNHYATLKYMSPVYGSRRLLLREFVRPTDLARLQQRFGDMRIVFLDRSDSPMFVEDAAANDAFLAAASAHCSVQLDHEARFGPATRLRALTLTRCTR